MTEMADTGQAGQAGLGAQSSGAASFMEALQDTFSSLTTGTSGSLGTSAAGEAAGGLGTGSVSPASRPAGAASPDPLEAAHSAFGADLATLLHGSESAAGAAVPDGSTAGGARAGEGERAKAGAEQPAASGRSAQPGQAAGRDGAGATGVDGAGGEGETGRESADGVEGTQGKEDAFEAALKQQGLWDTFKRREQSARDKGAERERQRLRNGEVSSIGLGGPAGQAGPAGLNGTAPVQGQGWGQGEQAAPGQGGQAGQGGHASLLGYVSGMPQEERVAFVQSLGSLGEYREAVAAASSSAASTAAGSVARDFAQTVGLDLGLVPEEAFQEAQEGKPERLRDAIIQHSRHIQEAIRAANEAGRRASRDQLRAANPLPPAGDAARAAIAPAQTYEEAQASFARALEGMGA